MTFAPCELSGDVSVLMLQQRAKVSARPLPHSCNGSRPTPVPRARQRSDEQIKEHPGHIGHSNRQRLGVGVVACSG